MPNLLEQHRQALKLAQQAFILKNQNNAGWIELFQQAFLLEKEVAYEYSSNRYESKNFDFSKSVLFRSAAALAKHSNNIQEIIPLVREGFKENPPKQIFRELLELLMNEQQAKFCFSESKNIRLLAPAGSGKTTSLLWRCLDQLKSKDSKARFLVFTFTRVARDELKDRIYSNPEFTDLRNNIRVETLNQWGYNYIRNNKEGLQLKSDKTDYYYLINNNLRPLWDRQPFLAKLTNKTFVFSQVINLFSEIKTLGFSHLGSQDQFLIKFREHFTWLVKNGLDLYFEEKIFKSVEDLELINYSGKDIIEQLQPFLLFWKSSTEELWRQSIITIEDQKYWALRILEEQYPEKKLFPASNRYNHILVDEFQDINPLDLQLIKRLCEVNNSTLAIVGDDDQAIYEWRGSSPKFILQPEQYLFKDFETFILEVNYRSPKNIVELSQQLIKRNTFRVNKNILPNSNKDAEVELIQARSHVASIPYIIDFAEAMLKNGNENVAIISRKKGQLVPLQILLTSKEIPFYAKEDLNILLSNAFNELKRILIIAIGKDQRKSSQTIAEEILTCCNLIKRYQLKKTEATPLSAYIVKNNPKTFLEGLTLLSQYTAQIKGNSGLQFSSIIAQVIDSTTVSKTISSIGELFEGLQKHYAKLDDDIFYKEPPFLYLADYAERYGTDFWKFIDHVEAAINKMNEITDHSQDSVDQDYKRKIHLMTALRAKGKEFDNVIILDVNDGLWPIKQAQTKEQLEQERRLFYVAITRTKKKLALITVDSIHGKKVYISPYVQEMGL